MTLRPAIIAFPRGIVGFENLKSYDLIPTYNPAFFWLKSLLRYDCRFLVTDPALFFPDYAFTLAEQTRIDLGLSNLADALILVIVNKHGETLTANLQAPLVINPATNLAAQIILSDKRYQTRHPLITTPLRKVAS